MSKFMRRKLAVTAALISVMATALTGSPAGAEESDSGAVAAATAPATVAVVRPVRSDACASNSACGSGTGTFTDARHITNYTQSVRTTKSSTICAIFGPPSIRIQVHYTNGTVDNGPRRYGNCSGSLVTFPRSSWTSSTRDIKYFIVVATAPRLGGTDQILGTRACRIAGC